MPFQKGEKNPMYGTHHTDEWKQMMSKVQKGKPKSEETKKRMSEAQKNRPPYPGHKHTQESKDKMSKNRMGMRFSEEHKQHLKESRKRQIFTPETRRKLSEYNKAHPESFEKLRHLRSFHPTKPQLDLFNIINKLYPNNHVETEWTVNTKKGRRYIDVAIPELLLGFEWDEPYWHKDKERDMVRHQLIEAEGWKLEHYSDVSEFPKK